MSTAFGTKPAKGYWKQLLIPLTLAAVSLLLVFVADMCLLFGSVFDQRHRVHGLKVLVVDFDGGAISEALGATYDTMKGPGFPELVFEDSSVEYSSPSDVREAVCTDGYWGAMYVHQDASERLASAIAGDVDVYQPNNTITYIYNQARYTTSTDALVGSNLQQLIAASRGTYYAGQDGQSALRNLNRTDQTAVEAYLNPIQPSKDIITPTMQGGRAFFNTLNVVFPILLCFFYVLALNGIAAQNNILGVLGGRKAWLFRFSVGKVYTFLAALCCISYIWAFREDWGLPSSKFPITWMIIWFQMDIYWQIFDALLGSIIPMNVSPLFMLTWVVFNVASAAAPLPLSAGFFRVFWAIPGYNVYSLQVRAWSGCTRQLHINLPVLMAWWLLGLGLSMFSVWRQCGIQKKAAQETGEKEESIRDNTGTTSDTKVTLQLMLRPLLLIVFVPFYDFILATPHKDKKVTEELLSNSSERFVFVRPSLLVDGDDETREVRVGLENPKTDALEVKAVGYTIPRGAVGRWMLEKVLEKAGECDYEGKAVSLTW